MRTRSAKKVAQRIDLHYFQRASPLRRWQTMLSIGVPLLGLLWLGGLAAAGSRAPFSSGPLSTAHAFVEAKCEVCHVRAASFRAHVEEAACLTCHDAPPHTANQPPPPDCATCHREHRGRVTLADTASGRCVGCHGSLTLSGSAARPDRERPFSRAPIARTITGFPSGHPEFAAAKPDAADPGTLKFNHAVHLKDGLLGPSGPETLQCAGCHKPEVARASSQRRPATGLMAPFTYEQQCARCHPLFFDERIDAPAPHEEPAAVRAFVERSLREYIAQHPSDLSRVDPPSRRLPLNFPRPAEPPAHTPSEWVERRTLHAEQLLWGRACAYCHQVGPSSVRSVPAARQVVRPLPAIEPVRLTAEWMPGAAFDHMPHLLIECASCHAAQGSRETSDVLMPALATCATCHAPDRGAPATCVECHGYHNWSRAHPVTPRFKITDFR